MTNRKITISVLSVVLAIVLVAIGMILLGIFSKKPIPIHSGRPSAKKFYVSTQYIQLGENTSSIIATGKVQSLSSVTLTSEVQGKISVYNIPLKKGADFKKGDLLIKIDNYGPQQALIASKSNFLKLIANILPDIKVEWPSEYDKWTTFFKDLEINRPLPPLPEIKNDREKTFIVNKNIHNLYYSLKADEDRLSKYQLKAPFDGSYSSVNVQEGSIANPGTPLATLIRKGNFEIELPIPTNQIDLISIGDSVEFKNKDNQFITVGKIIRKSVQVEALSQAIPVTVDLFPSTTLLDGMYLSAAIQGKSFPASCKVPRNAIFDHDKVYTVETQDSVSTLKQQNISILTFEKDSVIISGLETGQQLVNEALLGAKTGAQVQIRDQK